MTSNLKHNKLPEDRYFDRELSWLAFDERVLEEAMREDNHLLERLKFLSISASNLDEFYMVRVASIIDKLQADEAANRDTVSAKKHLKHVNVRANNIILQQEKVWKSIKVAMASEAIEIIDDRSKFSKDDVKWLHSYFQDNIFPVLTPIALDDIQPFPFLPNLSIAMIFEIEQLQKKTAKTKKSSVKKDKSSKQFKAVVPLPMKLDRFIRLPDGKNNNMRFVLLEKVLEEFKHLLFPDSRITNSGIIHITRSSELDIAEQADDLPSIMNTALKKRRRADIVRVCVNLSMPDEMFAFIAGVFDLNSENTMRIEGIFALSDIMMLYDAIDRLDLKYLPLSIRFPERIDDYKGDCFAAIEAKDIIVHHPYESFDVVARFIQQAAKDPDVIAIKQTLYRTSNDSPIVQALIDAAEQGKSVTVIIELKARFEEEANLQWGRNLELAGAQVIYGMAKLKTHVKVSLVIRNDSEGGTKSYVHFGTGNYHPVTARVYSDLSFFTCDPALCNDAALLFNYVTGHSVPELFQKISVAPLTLRERINELIADEITNTKLGKPACIWMKMNALVDKKIIDNLYAASQAGVNITLIVRGICCLKPGVKGLSENIRVKSIVGRFLEHSRIYCFGAGYELPSPQSKVFIGSADMMPRNLNTRIEVMVPIENPTVHEQVLEQIMTANIKDNKQSWLLQKDGSYDRVGESKTKLLAAHDYFIKNPSLSGRGKALEDK